MLGCLGAALMLCACSSGGGNAQVKLAQSRLSQAEKSLSDAQSALVDKKVGRVELRRDGKVEVERKNIISSVRTGQTITNLNPGGGGYGNPYERPIEKIIADVRNGLVSVAGAREDYGVVITDRETLAVDMAETKRLRGAAGARQAGA